MSDQPAVSSMTGFARAQGGDAALVWSWELKSVNGRGFDLRCRLPAGWESLEPALRARAARAIKRGNLQVGLILKSGPAASQPRINQPLLEQLAATARELSGRLEMAPPRLDALLAIRGVVEVAEEAALDDDARQAREAAALGDFEAALAKLSENRRGEGRRLAAVVEGHLAEIAKLTEAAAATAAAQPQGLRARLERQLDELLAAAPPLPEERLAQELALLASKADVREELDRLRAHVAAARELMVAGGSIGRKLDFLCQEFNREANTLCSKAAEVELTGIGLELKTVIDQLREQVQNIE
jgi:uncharacterized protein (TIGR00255 family)